MLLHSDGSHSGATSSMRNAERLVQVQMAHVCSDVTRTGKPHLSVHVGTVHVHLSTVLMDDVADLINALLVHTVRRRISHLFKGQAINLVGHLHY